MQTGHELLQQQVWMQLTGPSNCCSIIHPQTSCPLEIMIKCATVVKKSSKMYAVLYLAILVMQFNKIRREKKVRKSLLKWGKDFVGSLAFMSWLVGGMKTSLCLLNSLGSPLDGRAMPLLSLLGSISLFFNDTTKQSEIAYFVFVRACRSAYIYCKKRLKFPVSKQRQFCFIAIFVVISYLYFEGDPNIKNRKFLENLWGQF